MPMTRDELLQIHKELCTRSCELMKKKSEDYATGSDPFANFKRGEVLGFATCEEGLMLRVVDKISRISTFLKRGQLNVENESVEDSIMDIINYMVLLQGMLVDKARKESK